MALASRSICGSRCGRYGSKKKRAGRGIGDGSGGRAGREECVLIMWSRTYRVMLHEGFEHHKIESVYLQISRANTGIRRCSALTVIFYSIP